VGCAGGTLFDTSPGSLGSLVPAAGLGTRPVLVSSVRCSWACLRAARVWPCSTRISHAFLGLRWLSARIRFHQLRETDSSRALFASLAYSRGLQWLRLACPFVGRVGFALAAPAVPRSLCRVVSADIPNRFRSRDSTWAWRWRSGSARAAFRLLVWRPVRVRAGGERGRRVLGRGASLAARSPAGGVLAAINSRTSKRRSLRLGLIYFSGFPYGSDIFRTSDPNTAYGTSSGSSDLGPSLTRSLEGRLAAGSPPGPARAGPAGPSRPVRGPGWSRVFGRRPRVPSGGCRPDSGVFRVHLGPRDGGQPRPAPDPYPLLRPEVCNSGFCRPK